MEERVKLPVELPVSDPTLSCWQDPPSAFADHRSPELPSTADIVIVGSGISGTAVAWNLLNDAASQHDPSTTARPRIVMLEARQACSGATGRNGGHTKAASYRFFPTHVERLGTEAACQIARLELANIRATHAFAREHGIECESRPCQTIDVFYDPVEWERGLKAIEAMKKAMPGDDAAKYRIHSAETLRERFYVGEDEDVKGGVIGGVEYEAGSISAYLFTIGVLRLCMEKGLQLETHTPALSIHRKKGDQSTTESRHKWVVQTSRGSIETRTVVLATNGYTAFLEKKFQGVIVPIKGQITALRPGSDIPSAGLATTYCFVYGKGFEYMVSRPLGTPRGGDIVIGGGFEAGPSNGLDAYGTVDDSVLDRDVSRYLNDSMPRYFGSNWGEDHPDGRIRQEWTGIMGYTADGYPMVGEAESLVDEDDGGQGADQGGLWVTAGFQGHGMVFCWMCARALGEMIAGRDGPALRGWFPWAFRMGKRRFGQKFEGTLL